MATLRHRYMHTHLFLNDIPLPLTVGLNHTNNSTGKTSLSLIIPWSRRLNLTPSPPQSISAAIYVHQLVIMAKNTLIKLV